MLPFVCSLQKDPSTSVSEDAKHMEWECRLAGSMQSMSLGHSMLLSKAIIALGRLVSAKALNNAAPHPTRAPEEPQAEVGPLVG